MLPRLVLALSVALTLAIATTTPGQESSQCANCHFANPSAPRPDHLLAWQSSAHGRSGVGCEACHRGDPNTFESFAAHEGILASSNPASPTHWSQHVETCGRCHSRQRNRFERSRHSQVLRNDDGHGRTRAPTCTTCHGTVAAHLLNADGLEQRCGSCHATGKTAGHPEHPLEARALHDRFLVTREVVATASRLRRRVDDPARRTELEEQIARVERELVEAIRDSHDFQLGASMGHLDEAERQLERLLETLLSSGP